MSYASNSAGVRVQLGHFLKCDLKDIIVLFVAALIAGGAALYGQIYVALAVLGVALFVTVFSVMQVRVLFAEGDVCPALVLDSRRGLVAVYTDLIKGGKPAPVVKVLKQPLGRVTGGPFKAKKRLAFVALYNGFPSESRWRNFGGYLVNTATTNRKAIQRVVEGISDEEWSALERGVEMLDKPYRVSLYEIGRARMKALAGEKLAAQQVGRIQLGLLAVCLLLGFVWLRAALPLLALWGNLGLLALGIGSLWIMANLIIANPLMLLSLLVLMLTGGTVYNRNINLVTEKNVLPKKLFWRGLVACFYCSITLVVLGWYHTPKQLFRAMKPAPKNVPLGQFPVQAQLPAQAQLPNFEQQQQAREQVRQQHVAEAQRAQADAMKAWQSQVKGLPNNLTDGKKSRSPEFSVSVNGRTFTLEEFIEEFNRKAKMKKEDGTQIEVDILEVLPGGMIRIRPVGGDESSEQTVSFPSLSFQPLPPSSPSKK